MENTRSFVSTDQVRDWCANPDTHVTIRPGTHDLTNLTDNHPPRHPVTGTPARPGALETLASA